MTRYRVPDARAVTVKVRTAPRRAAFLFGRLDASAIFWAVTAALPVTGTRPCVPRAPCAPPTASAPPIPSRAPAKPLVGAFVRRGNPVAERRAFEFRVSLAALRAAVEAARAEPVRPAVPAVRDAPIPSVRFCVEVFARLAVVAPFRIPELRVCVEALARAAVVAPLVIPGVRAEDEPLTGRAAPLAPPSPRDAVAEASARAAVVAPLRIPDPLPGD